MTMNHPVTNPVEIFDNEHTSNDGIENNYAPSHVLTPLVKIDFDDNKEELEFWESVVVCYVLGANPPHNVMEGYVRRIWVKFGVDKVSQVGKGIYMVRFTTMENCGKVLQGGFQFFDSKPPDSETMVCRCHFSVRNLSRKYPYGSSCKVMM